MNLPFRTIRANTHPWPHSWRKLVSPRIGSTRPKAASLKRRSRLRVRSGSRCCLLIGAVRAHLVLPRQRGSSPNGCGGGSPWHLQFERSMKSTFTACFMALDLTFSSAWKIAGTSPLTDTFHPAHSKTGHVTCTSEARFGIRKSRWPSRYCRSSSSVNQMNPRRAQHRAPQRILMFTEKGKV